MQRFRDSTDWECMDKTMNQAVTSYEPSGRADITDLFNVGGDASAHSVIVLDDIFTGTIKEIHVCDVTLHNTLQVGDDTTLVGHGEAIIDPLEQDRGIHISGVRSLVQGFTVTNGEAEKGGAIYCDSELENMSNWLNSRIEHTSST